MTLYDIFTLLGGLTLFLYGMHVMGDGLEKASGSHLERTLERMTNSTLKGVLLGAGVTAVIQSSAATTVMVVGFVNSGIMKLSQAIGVIMGANIGTTATAWILSLTGIQGDSLLINLFKPSNFAPVIGVIGVILAVFVKSGKKKDIGSIFVGFAILMIGMNTVTQTASALKDVPEFISFITMFSNPVFGILAGMIMTTLLQSSSASVGILQALCITGSVTFGSAIPIIMGQNIGTCTTALFSCIGASKNAKRAAVVHLYFNLIGTAIFMILFYGLDAVLHFSFIDESMTAASIATVHSIFNVATTLLLLPFSKGLGKLAEFTIRDKGETRAEIYLDERFLNTPSFAIEQCKNLTYKMAALARETIIDAISCITEFSPETAAKVAQSEQAIDTYEDTIGTYLVKLSSRSLSLEDSNAIAKLLHTIGDLERIGDHATNIIQVASEMNTKKIRFSAEASAEISVITGALLEILDITTKAFQNDDYELAHRVEPLEQVIDELDSELKSRHIYRLQSGHCTIELGFVFSDLLTNYERVSDHCSNIALCMIQIKETAFDTHSYVDDLLALPQPQFVADYESFRSKYLLPKYTTVEQ